MSTAHSARRTSILVGIDFSTSARRALDVATAIAVRAGCRLDLLHVWNANHLAGAGAVLPQLEAWITEQRASYERQLEEWASDARDANLKVRCRVIEGAASRAIPAAAESEEVWLVVVGRRGAAHLDHVLLGSVSERITRLSPKPVLVVPDKAPVIPPERLIVGIDFSAPARDAFDAALDVARRMDPKRGLLVAHVHPPGRKLGPGESPRDRYALERWVDAADACSVPIELRVLEGFVSITLLEVARQDECGWIVVGFQGRSALASFLMGSTADHTLRLSDRPVLVVPTRHAAPEEATG
jgi:nucleotide-binding universal stress UspA family protein